MKKKKKPVDFIVERRIVLQIALNVFNYSLPTFIDIIPSSVDELCSSLVLVLFTMCWHNVLRKMKQKSKELKKSEHSLEIDGFIINSPGVLLLLRVGIMNIGYPHTI